MKKIILFSFLVSLVILTFIASYNSYSKDTTLHASSEQQEKGPHIKLSNNSYSADTAMVNLPLTYKIKYKNTGDAPLLVTKVRTSCSCTVASYSKTPLEPGASDYVVLTLDTNKPGIYIKTVAIYSNATNNFDESIGKSRTLFTIKWVVVNKKVTPKQ